MNSVKSCQMSFQGPINIILVVLQKQLLEGPNNVILVVLQKQLMEVFYKKVVLQNFAKFTGK